MKLSESNLISMACYALHNKHYLYYMPSKHVKSEHYRPASETPFDWRFAGGPIVALDLMLAGVYCKNGHFFAKGCHNICIQLDVMHASSDFLVNVTILKRKEINNDRIS